MWAMIACCIALVLWCVALTWKDQRNMREKEGMAGETRALNQSPEHDTKNEGRV